MEIIQVIEAACAASNTERDDWVDGAAELVCKDEVAYRREHNQPLICYDNVLSDVMCMDAFEELMKQWLLNEDECCDIRDKINELIYNHARELLSVMADDYCVGVE